MSSDLRAGRCPVCWKPIDRDLDWTAVAWWAVWNGARADSELRDVTHAGRCTELARRAYYLTADERAEIARMREADSNGNTSGA